MEKNMLVPHGIVIALVNAEKFEVYRNAGTETEPRLAAVSLPELETHNKGAGVRHQVSPANPSGNLLEEDAHAAAVAEWLNLEALNHRFSRLVIVAAPRTLGELRRRYHKELEAVLVAELDKDLLGSPPAAIISALRAKE
jgi:protein required for attachment to host cells